MIHTMIASERLRELERWQADEIVFVYLPLIADVVEAAEDAADHFIDQSAHDHIWPIELKTALAALRDALAKGAQ